MKFSGHTNATYGYGLGKTLDLFVRLGFDGLDVGCNPLSDISISLPDEEKRELARLVRNSGLGVSCLASYAGEGEDHLGSADPKRRRAVVDEQKRHIDLATELGARGMRVFCGKDVPPGDARRRCFRLCVESMGELADWANGSGVALFVENHPATLTVSSTQTVELVSAVGEPHVKVLYDPSNLIVFAGEQDVEASFARQQDAIGHVHVKDQVLDDQGRYRDIVPGRGVLPWDRFVSLLEGIGYQGYLAIEYQRGRASTENLPDPEVGLREGLAFLKRLTAARAEG